MAHQLADLFLSAALGLAGAAAVRGAASGELKDAALPRVAMAWVRAASEHGWDGQVPGLAGVNLALAKGEVEGTLELGSREYAFDSLEKASAAIALVAGFDPRSKTDATPEALAKFGEGVEAVARARFGRALEKADNVIKFPNPYPIRDELARLPQPYRKRQPKDELAGRRKQAVDQKRAKVKEILENAFGIMGQDPGFQQAAQEKQRVAKEQNLARGPQLYQTGQPVLHRDHDQYPWVGKVSGYELADIDGDAGPQHYYEVNWWNPKLNQHHEGFHHQDELTPFKKDEPAAPEVGQAAAPKKAAGPEAPAAPTTGVEPPKPGTAQGTTERTQERPAPKRKNVFKLTKSQALARCELCGDPLIVGGRFVGCAHFSELAKSAFVSETATGCVLELRGDWDPEAAAGLARAFQGGD
jgi:hypothetical protein